MAPRKDCALTIISEMAGEEVNTIRWNLTYPQLVKLQMAIMINGVFPMGQERAKAMEDADKATPASSP